MRSRLYSTVVAVGLASVSLQADPIMNTGGQVGISRTMSTTTMGQGSILVGATGKADMLYNGIRMIRPKASNSRLLDTVAQSAFIYSEDIYAGVGVFNWLDLSLDLPFYQDQWDKHTINPAGIGDLSIALKAEHPGLHPAAPLRQGYYLRMTVPTGTGTTGYIQRHAYNTKEGVSKSNAYTVPSLALSPMFLWTLDGHRMPYKIPVQLHVNAGGFLQLQTGGTDSGNLRQHSSILASVAIEYAHNAKWTGFLEVSGETKAQNLVDGFNMLSDWNKDVLRLSAGGKYSFENGIHTSFSVDVGLSDNDRYFEWQRYNDAKVNERYRVTGTPTVGLTLNVGYGRRAERAKIPVGHFGDVDASYAGAPKIIRDTILIRVGAGSPLLLPKGECDTVRTVIRDTLRTVVRDTLRDTVKVMDVATRTNAIELGRFLGARIHFKHGYANISPDSYSELDNLARYLAQFPTVQVEVRGFSDNTGTRKERQEISEERAKAVSAYLTRRGVKAERLKVVGLSDQDPVADNNTEKGREQNRRVEFFRIEQ